MLNTLMQAGLMFFTLGGLLLTSFKLPEYGLIMNLIAQVFWIYSSYKAWKEAKQFGMFVNSCIFTVIVGFGVINYWFL